MMAHLTWDDLKPILKNTPKEINEFEYRNNMHLLKGVVLIIDDTEKTEFYIDPTKGICCREKGFIQ